MARPARRDATSWKGWVGQLLPDTLFRALSYRRAHGRWPNLRHPRAYTEKMNWRILRDRRPALAWTCDKLAMKDHAADRRPDLRIARTIWHGTNLAELATIDLPDRWVLKPNNSSALVIVGHGVVDAAEVERLRTATKDWLKAREYRRLREWAYAQARPLLLVEEFIGSDDAPPIDHKFYVFDGRPAFIAVDLDRFTGHRRSFFTPDWELLSVRTKPPPAGDQPRPRHLERMLAIAGDLGRDFDHIRIDLYEVGDEIWFGEYTPYSWSGMQPITPVAYDIAWGDLWRLPDPARTT